MKLLQNLHGGGKPLCAFCKFWNDPGNTAISPKFGQVWEYDPSILQRCLKNPTAKTYARQGCSMYKCKM